MPRRRARSCTRTGACSGCARRSRHAGEVKPGWAVLTEIAHRAGTELGIERSADAFEQLVARVPFYEGLTLEALGGHGLRWPERPQARTVSARSSVGRHSPPPRPAGRRR